MDSARELKREQAHDKIEQLIKDKEYKQTEMADLFGISYRTFWQRRKEKSWTGKEVRITLNNL